jgi:hypothetical protein
MACVPYSIVVGILMYSMVFTQLDISHGLGVLSIYISTPRKENSTVVKRVFKYLCGTKYYVIFYQGNLEANS